MAITWVRVIDETPGLGRPRLSIPDYQQAADKQRYRLLSKHPAVDHDGRPIPTVYPTPLGQKATRARRGQATTTTMAEEAPL